MIHTFSTLSNGLRVATRPAFGKFCTLGVAIQAGSRFEACFSPGTAHFVEKLSFSIFAHIKSTKKYKRKDILEIMERSNALIDCQSSKDTFMYAASCRTESAGQILDLIADAVFHPVFNEGKMINARHAIRFENETLSRNPECEPLLTDWIHQAAYRDNTIGLPKYCASEAVDGVSVADVLTFLSQFYSPKRIVLAGVGVPQDWLEELGKELFDEKTATWQTESSRLMKNPPSVDDSVAQYTGGEIRVEKDLSKMALGPTPFPNLAHIVVGFQAVGITHPDFVPFCVLQSLMGGGGSFSAGGPGKGMYTRLYTDVMNQYHWVYNATAFNHSYTDAGIFCIRASADPKRLSDLPYIVLREFVRLAEKTIYDDELARAKTQLKSQLMMNLEVRPVQFEDMSRQILVHNKCRDPLEYCALIDKVNADDLKRVSRFMLDSKLSLVGYGDLRSLPAYETIRRKAL